MSTAEQKTAEGRTSQPEAGTVGVSDKSAQPEHDADSQRGNTATEQSTKPIKAVWTEQLSKKHTQNSELMAKLGSIGSIDDLVQAYIEAIPPGEDAPEAEKKGFYERIGRPKEPGGYKIASENKALAEAAHEANLTDAQAIALHNAQKKQAEAERQQKEEALAKEKKAVEQFLQEEYGKNNRDGYEEAQAMLKRGLGNNAASGELSDIAKVLTDSGLIYKPEIVRAFVELGYSMSEASTPRASGRGGLPASITQGRSFVYKDDYAKQ